MFVRVSYRIIAVRVTATNSLAKKKNGEEGDAGDTRESIWNVSVTKKKKNRKNVQ